MLDHRGLSVYLGNVTHPNTVKIWETDWSFLRKHLVRPKPKLLVLTPGEQRSSLSLLLVLSMATWLLSHGVAMASRRKPEYCSTAVDFSWKHAKLAKCWTGLILIRA